MTVQGEKEAERASDTVTPRHCKERVTLRHFALRRCCERPMPRRYLAADASTLRPFCEPPTLPRLRSSINILLVSGRACLGTRMSVEVVIFSSAVHEDTGTPAIWKEGDFNVLFSFHFFSSPDRGIRVLPIRNHCGILISVQIIPYDSIIFHSLQLPPF